MAWPVIIETLRLLNRTAKLLDGSGMPGDPDAGPVRAVAGFGKYEWVEADIRERERIQLIFFIATFYLLGFLSKLDGIINEEERNFLKRLMEGLELDGEHEKLAERYFEKGSQGDWQQTRELMAFFHKEAGRRKNLIKIFLEIQLEIIYADNLAYMIERDIVEQVAQLLKFSLYEYFQLENKIRREHAFGGDAVTVKTKAPAHKVLPPTAKACHVLDLDADAGLNEVKKAYRRLLKQYHPDTLFAKGLPEQMLIIASEKTREIKAAYELLRKELTPAR